MAPSRGDYRSLGTFRDGLFVKPFRPSPAVGRPRRRACVLAVCIFVYVLGVLLLSAAGPASDRRNYPDAMAPAPAAVPGSATGASYSRGRLEWCSPIRFFPDDRPRPTTALVSYPGSGNTWLRYLLQQATGIHTGSIYKDYGLMKNGFPAEKVRNGSVLAVKTHEWGPSGRTGYHRAVLLIRQPADAILAEFNRQSGGHIGVAALDRFQLKQGRLWRHFVRSELTAWRALNLDWLTNFTGPTHVVVYENLVSDTEAVLRAALAFLEVGISDSQLECALRRKEGIYRRRKRNLPPGFDPYSPDMRAAISVVEESVMSRVRQFMALAVPSFSKFTS